MTTVSVITTTWNSAGTIADTLKSVNCQTYSDIEHVIIDGASSDRTLDIVARQGLRVGKLLSEPDRGIYDAFNKGLTQATGDIIGYLNSDDYYAHNGVIQKVVENFEDPSIDAVHADLVYVDATDTSRARRHWRGKDLADMDLRRGLIPAHPTVFLRRSAYERVGAYNEVYTLAADHEFLLRAFYVHRLRARYVPETWVRMRTGGATGGAIGSIALQNEQIRIARESLGIHYPRTAYIALKLISRATQIARARLVRSPSLVAGTEESDFAPPGRME